MHWQVWESWGAEPWLVQVLKVGYRVPFVSRPPVSSAAAPSELLSLFHPGIDSNCCCGRFVLEGCHRTGILSTRLLQPPLYNTEGHRRLEARHRSFSPQPLCQCLPFSYGDIAIRPPFSASWGLDGIHRSSGCLPSGSSPSGLSSVPSILFRPTNIPISGSVFRPFNSTASLHLCHGPELLHHASFWSSDLPLPG